MNVWEDSSSSPSTEPAFWGVYRISALLPQNTTNALSTEAPSEKDWGIKEGSTVLMVLVSWKKDDI